VGRIVSIKNLLRVGLCKAVTCSEKTILNFGKSVISNGGAVDELVGLIKLTSKFYVDDFVVVCINL
jgi:hypothetical protein